MEVLFERVAGLDIGKATLTVCVRTPGPRGRRGEGVDLDLLEGTVLLLGGGAGGLGAQCGAHQGRPRPQDASTSCPRSRPAGPTSVPARAMLSRADRR
jgi:hypothetical protein